MVSLKNFSASGNIIALLLFGSSLVILDVNCFTLKLFKKVACIKHKRQKNKRLFCATADNFYEVEKNIFYRSKQLTHKKLHHYINKFGIKTIINLRGKNEHRKWWRREKMVADSCGVKMYNIPMSAHRIPEKKHLNFLFYLYKNSQIAPRPILIHCNGGADRTGEAAALWVITQQKKSKKAALRQLSLKYGHIRWKAPLKRRFVKAFSP